jgi:hypothetical protein
VLIYCTHISQRLQYISHFLFTKILGVPVQYTHNREEFVASNDLKINYSDEKLDAISILPHGLLSETEIRQFEPLAGEYNGTATIFANTSNIPFDPLAAAFFMVSRYEEYWPQPTDHHHRFISNYATAFKHDFLHIPVVDRWAFMLRDLLTARYPHYPFRERAYEFIPTVDVDIAYAYRYRNLYRTLGATARAIVEFRKEELVRQFKVLVLRERDPYDTFFYLHKWHDQYNLKPLFFFLVGKYGKFDKNISPKRKAIRNLIRDIHERYAVGIHPSYRSNKHPWQLKNEIKTLEDIVGHPVTLSRQHFLKLRLPYTYQQLIANGISDDYSMGFASHAGFRAGTCTPFPFYDLSAEKETSLIVHPFQVMDGTLHQYRSLSPLEAIEQISQLINEVRKVNGTFISLWHNTTLSELHQWKDWREVYQAVVEIAAGNGKK